MALADDAEVTAMVIRRDSSPLQKPDSSSVAEDIAPDKAFVVHGGQEADRPKPGSGVIGLTQLGERLRAREQGK